ncbi:MAG TPA: dioxygenase [Chloroflexota bacterium]
MQNMRRGQSVTRRRLLGAWLAGSAGVLLAACGGAASTAGARPTGTGSGASATAGAAPPAPITPPAAPATATSAAGAPTAPAAASAARPSAAPSGTSPAAAAAAGQLLAPTPSCADAHDRTPAQTEGPYFKPSSPERASLLEPGMAGTRLTLSGRVLTTRCQPVAQALLDFWQADDRGEYDNRAFRLRGHLFSGADGTYRLETIVPGLYPGRTRHVHVKVQAPNGPLLTTQLYFPGESRNSSDGIFDQKLVMAVQDGGGARLGGFDFVLNG